MAQRRIQDFGSPVTAANLKALASAFSGPAVLSGNTFVADGADRLRVNPGSSITDEGVVIIESEPRFLTVPNTSNPVDYTVYYLHNDADISGGIPAELIIDAQLLDNDSIEGVILGYVRYPGGGIPLSSAHFIQEPVVQLGEVSPKEDGGSWHYPIKNSGYLITSTSGAALNITDVFDVSGSQPEMFVRIRNNDTVTGSTTLTFPFKVGSQPFSRLELVIATEINATVTPLILDSNGDSFSLVTTPLTGDPGLELETLTIPREAIQTPNTTIYLQLQISLFASREVRIQALGLNTFNSPI